MAQAGLDFDEYAEHLMAIVAEACGGESTVLYRLSDGRLYTRNLDEKQRRYLDISHALAATRYAGDLETAFSISAEVGACTDRDIWTPRERERRLYHQEILEPARVRSMLHLCARWQGVPLFRINLNRHGNKPFSARERDRAIAFLPVIEASVVAYRATSLVGAWEKLTTREVEVARHVARGLTNPQIAMLLGTSKFTVRNQLASIFDKLQVASRAELAAWMAAREGVFDSNAKP